MKRTLSKSLTSGDLFVLEEGQETRRATEEDVRHFELMERLDELNRLLGVIAGQAEGASSAMQTMANVSSATLTR